MCEDWGCSGWIWSSEKKKTRNDRCLKPERKGDGRGENGWRVKNGEKNTKQWEKNGRI